MKYKSICYMCHCVLKCVKSMREMFTLDRAMDLLKERRNKLRSLKCKSEQKKNNTQLSVLLICGSLINL